MIIDFRTYRYAPAGFSRFLEMYRETGFAITSRWLGTTVGIFTSHAGIANRTLQMFAYRDFAHRDACRAGLRQDRDWLAFIKEAAIHIREQHNVVVACEGASWDRLQHAAGADSPGGLFELRRERMPHGQLQRLLDARGARTDGLGLFRPLTGELDTGYMLTRYADDAARHVALFGATNGNGTGAAEASALPIQSVEADLWLPTAYSPLR